MTAQPELILHIGHYKTGTTALQAFCNLNQAALAQQGLVYATEPLKHAKHSALAFSLLHEAGVSTLMHGYNHPVSAEGLWSRLFEQTRALPQGAAMLVSTEEFMRLGAHPAATEGLRRIIAGAPDIRFRIVAYLRPPQEHLQSWYNQLVKMGIDTGSFDVAVRGQMEAIHLDYGLALAPWIDLFGADAVVLRGYDRAMRHGDGLFADFLGALGRRMPAAPLAPVKDPNPRLDDRTLALRRALGRSELQGKLAERFLTRATDSLRADDGAAALIGAPGFDALRERAQAAILTLAELPQAALDLDGMLAALPTAQDAYTTALEQNVVMLVNELASLRKLLVRTTARVAALEGQGGAGAPAGEDS